MPTPRDTFEIDLEALTGPSRSTSAQEERAVMAKLIADMSMSLDGFVADENDGVDEVFAWYSTGPESVSTASDVEMHMTEGNAKAFEENTSGVGAILTGRRTSDAANAWGGQHPVGVPTYVVSHRPPPEDLDSETSTVHFVDDLVEAVRQAQKAAGEKSVGVAGGDTVRQLLALGLLDEIRVSLVPVLLGKGIPYFPDLENAPVALEGPKVREGNGVTHLHYRVAR
jgi:dihydrofolate reductase